MISIYILKTIDKLLGRALIAILPETKKAPAIPHSAIKNILIIRPGGIGDFVLLLPALRILKNKFPHSNIDILCESRNVGISFLATAARNIYRYNNVASLMKCLANRYDLVIDTEQWHRSSAFVAFLTHAPLRIGFDTNERRKVFTHKIPYSHDDYEMYSFLNLIRPIVNEVPAFNNDAPFTGIPQEVPEHLAIDPRSRYITLFIGASTKERKWDMKKFGAVASFFIGHGHKIILLGGKKEMHDAFLITKSVPSCIDLTGKTSLKDVAFILSISRVLLTNDSGIMHMAYGLGTPTVSLFGPSNEKKWAPGGKKHIVIHKHLDCSPCSKFGYTPRCSKDVACMSLITSDEVITSIEGVLTNKGGT
ncbi:MAG: glycosyltransferase family 9 protein [Candidatus Omnitrophica bacterium]|nr:glycosyltransferase family 9 protein [Candidatus Omnitrophota bacterium]